MKKYVLIAGIWGLSFMSLFSQRDTLTVMFYNLLNFPSNSATPTRQDTLEKIVQYVQPDILLVCELSNVTGANQILTQSLNVNGITHYQMANFVPNRSTSNNLQNLLYYNGDKLGLRRQSEILTSLRDFNKYEIWYKDPNLASHNDTTWTDLFVNHLKAGTSDQTRRNADMTLLRNHLNAYPTSKPIIFAGDYNIYHSLEPAYQTITQTGTYPLADPISSPGNWDKNSVFAHLHTQSTRAVGFNGGASSGMDDRLDHILIDSTIFSDTAGRVHYIPGTYHALGQDGLHFDQSLLSPPLNTTVPPDILNALYYMSDHLPVVMQIEVVYPVVLPSEMVEWQPEALEKSVQTTISLQPGTAYTQVELERKELSGFEKVASSDILAEQRDLVLLDNSPKAGLSAYRLHFRDKNGTESYSDVRTIRFLSATGLQVNIVQPAHESLEIQIGTENAVATQWELVNVYGVRMKAGKWDLPAGNSAHLIPVSDLAHGVYLLQLHSSGHVESHKVLIQR